MQYVNKVKSSMQDMYDEVNNAFTCDITYQLNMSEVPGVHLDKVVTIQELNMIPFQEE